MAQRILRVDERQPPRPSNMVDLQEHALGQSGDTQVGQLAHVGTATSTLDRGPLTVHPLEEGHVLALLGAEKDLEAMAIRVRGNIRTAYPLGRVEAGWEAEPTRDDGQSDVVRHTACPVVWLPRSRPTNHHLGHDDGGAMGPKRVEPERTELKRVARWS